MSEHKDFVLFKKEFKKWQDRFGLSGYEVHFKHERDDGFFASIAVDQEQMSATVILNKELPDKDKPHQDIKRDAKHEALHLLLSRLEKYGRDRYIAPEKIYEATEELVNKLMGLIE